MKKENNKFIDWYSKQNEKFKKELNPKNIACRRFIDWNEKAIDLEQLKRYDKIHCNGEEN